MLTENVVFDMTTLSPAISIDKVRETIDLLLQRLKTRKENGIDHARPCHRYAETSIHGRLVELDAGNLDRLAFGLGEAIALVVGFGGVDGVDLVGQQMSFHLHDQQGRGRKERLTHAHDTSPQKPPAIATDEGEVGELLP